MQSSKHWQAFLALMVSEISALKCHLSLNLAVDFLTLTQDCMDTYQALNQFHFHCQKCHFEELPCQKDVQ